MNLHKIRRGNSVREYGLELTKLWHMISGALDAFFPNSTPGYYNNPLGRKRAVRWTKMLDTKTRIYALMHSIMFNPIGTYLVTQDHTSIFGWMLLAFGTYSIVFLFHMQYLDKEKQNQKNTIYETQINDLRERVTKLENTRNL